MWSPIIRQAGKDGASSTVQYSKHRMKGFGITVGGRERSDRRKGYGRSEKKRIL
jgi:hypothetical protein